MGNDRLKMPPVADFGFYQRRKHDKWREVSVPSPVLEGPVADSHAHVHMLPDPAWELARCAANNVDFVCMIVDPSEDGARPFDRLDGWITDAQNPHPTTLQNESESSADSDSFDRMIADEGFARWSNESQSAVNPDLSQSIADSDSFSTAGSDRGFACPEVRIAAGVHPHNAKLYDDAMECALLQRLGDSRVAALGEIGLDYHYDLSPREVQCDVFCRQVEIAQQRDLPIVLHLRGGEDLERDNAHREAFEILQDMDALGPHTLLHCCTLAPDEIEPWIQADCHIAYGGALTFKSAEAAREGARLVPLERLMLETDSPYMTPEPMRGAACTPAHVVFTAAVLAEVRGVAPGEERRAFLEQLHENTLCFFANRRVEAGVA